MGKVRVKYNNFPAIGRAMPLQLEHGVDGTADEMAETLRQRVWYLTGVIQDTTTAEPKGVLHAEVWCGLRHNRGFYSRFQEHGTVHQRARPIVLPTAREYEPIYAANMEHRIRRACNAK